MFDLTNSLLYFDRWVPQNLPPPYVNELLQVKQLQLDLEYGQAEEVDVKLDPSILSGTEGYIDNEVCVVLDFPINWKMVARAVQVVVMALFLIFHPLTNLMELIKRPDPVSI